MSTAGCDTKPTRSALNKTFGISFIHMFHMLHVFSPFQDACAAAKCAEN